MPSIINAATSGGLISTADTSGVLQLQTASTTAMTIDASQNVGIGVTPSAWRSINKALQVGTVSNISNIDATVNSGVDIGYNYFFNSGGNAIYLINAASSYYRQQGGNHFWNTAASGTAGNTISFTQSLAVGRGTTLALEGASSVAGTGITFPATQSASSNANTLDDYEEGTWSPVATAQTGSITSYTSTGQYTKIGRNVFLTFCINLTNVGTASGRMTISNMPFTALDLAGGRPAVFAGRENAATGIPVIGWLNGGQTSGEIASLAFGDITWTNNYAYTMSVTYQQA